MPKKNPDKYMTKERQTNTCRKKDRQIHDERKTEKYMTKVRQTNACRKKDRQINAERKTDKYMPKGRQTNTCQKKEDKCMPKENEQTIVYKRLFKLFSKLHKGCD